MTGLRAFRVIAAVLAAGLVPAGAGCQKLGLDGSKPAVAAITGVQATQLLLAEGWPDRLTLYVTNWGSPMRLIVGASNVTQIQDLAILDKASRPAPGFDVGFTPLSPPACSSGSSVCVEVAIRPTTPAPGTYRIGLVGDGQLLVLDVPLEVGCNPFERPMTVSLAPRSQLAGRTISGRIQLGCPALQPDVPASVVGYYEPGSGGQVGATVVRLRPTLSAPSWTRQQIDFPDSLIVPPGQTTASFEMKIPGHLAPVQGKSLHEDNVSANLQADLRGGAAKWGNEGVVAVATFTYPRMDPTALSIPKDIVGPAPVVGSVGLTQPAIQTETVCFSVYTAQGRPAGTAGHRFVVAASGDAGPSCVTIPAGQTTTAFQLSAELSAASTRAEDFVLRGTQSHREPDGSYSPLDSVSVSFRARAEPRLNRVTMGAPMSQPSSINPYVDGSVAGEIFGYVALTSAASPGGLSVKLACKPSDRVGEQLCERYVSVADAVTIPGGVTEMAFPIHVRPSPVEGGVSIQATLGGRDVVAPLWVDLPPEVTHVGVSSSGGGRVLTVHVSEVVRAAPTRVAVSAEGDGAGFLQIPEVVEVPVGENMVNINIPSTPIPKAMEVILTAGRVGSKIRVTETDVLQP